MEINEIKGLINPELINTHMRAAAAKDDCRRELRCLYMEHKEGMLHLITTNGKILLHSTMSDLDAQLESAPDFKVCVEITRKLKKPKHGKDISFTIKDGKVFFKSFDIFDAFEVYKDKEYPNYENVEQVNKHTEALKVFVPVDPRWLDIALEYVGMSAYYRPYIVPVDEGIMPIHYWQTDEGVTKHAVIAPMRVEE